MEQIHWEDLIKEIIRENPEIPVDLDIEKGKNAVRYGYQYRKVAEEDCENIHFRLAEIEPIIYWLGTAILSGVAYDMIKSVVKTIIKKIGNRRNLSKGATILFSSDENLREFYEYIREYDDGFIHIKESERRYIESEMRADIFGKLSSDFYFKNGRNPTVGEYMELFKKEKEQLDEMLKRNSNK